MAVVAAAFFENHQTRALRVLNALGYLTGAVSATGGRMPWRSGWRSSWRRWGRYVPTARRPLLIL